ncbi:MAG TPA: HIT domain-containing protein [Gaiellaceae bacterium]|jgi:ATP adenylyltransferase|nr:HIT domain-containing protein [Gaiellaceae bacterium]
MTKPVWAPWRLEYIATADEQSGCVFCEEAAGTLGADASLLVHASAEAIVILNKYPYSSGHLMVAPRRHLGALAELADREALEIHRLAVRATAVLGDVYGPGGYNLGWNLGHVAGAGIADHVHLHVVPRWAGDTNFMPVLADVKVIPEHLLATRDRLREAWPTG